MITDAQPSDEPLVSLFVVRPVCEDDVPLSVQAHPVLRVRQVLRREREVERMARHQIEREPRRNRQRAGADTDTTPAEYSSRAPLRLTITLLTARPDGIVSSRSAKAFVSSVTLGNSSAGSTASTCASAFARTRQGNPSQAPQRMHWLQFGFFSSIWIPKSPCSPCTWYMRSARV